jgi:SAM-dependent methyltransferase
LVDFQPKVSPATGAVLAGPVKAVLTIKHVGATPLRSPGSLPARVDQPAASGYSVVMVRESFPINSSVPADASPSDGEPALDWGGEAGRRWLQVADRVEAQLAPVSDVLFAALGLTPGERVLDVGCGLGSTTRHAAALVGPTGWVTGIDVAVDLIDEARRLTVPDGAPLEWIAGNAQTTPLPTAHFDVVTSRFGVIFFDDPVAAFSNLARSTRKGGRLCAAVWQARDRSPILQHSLDVATVVAAAHGHHLDVGAPNDGPFAYGEAAFVRPRLEAAGWVDVTLAAHTLDMYLFGPGNVEDAVEAGLTFGTVRTALDDAPVAVVDAVRDALVEDLATRHDGTGVRMSAAVSILTARVG